MRAKRLVTSLIVVSVLAVGLSLAEELGSVAPTEPKSENSPGNPSGGLNGSAHGPSTTPKPHTEASNSTFVGSKLRAKPKVEEYLRPICVVNDKLSQKQISAAHKQLIRLIEMTNGKLAACFHEHYSYDPTIVPTSKDDLLYICKSKTAPEDHKVSLAAFEGCAASHWNEIADKELERILRAREEGRKHQVAGKEDLFGEPEESESQEHAPMMGSHNLTDSKLANLTSSISHTIMKDVNKTVSTLEMAGKKTIGLIDSLFNHQGSNSTDQPSNEPNLGHQNSTSAHGSGSRSADNSTAPHQADTLSGASPSSTTSKPVHLNNSDNGNGTTARPDHGNSSQSAGSSHTPPGLSGLFQKVGQNSSVPANDTLKRILTTTSTTTKAPQHQHGHSTSSPASSNGSNSATMQQAGDKSHPKQDGPKKSSTTKQPWDGKQHSVSANKTTTTPKPDHEAQSLESIEQLLKRQEREQLEFEDRLKVERQKLMRQLHEAKMTKGDHEHDHQSDQMMHQMEHQRQMMIDPVGHTIKHQQYEINKQRRLSGAPFGGHP